MKSIYKIFDDILYERMDAIRKDVWNLCGSLMLFPTMTCMMYMGENDLKYYFGFWVSILERKQIGTGRIPWVLFNVNDDSDEKKLKELVLNEFAWFSTSNLEPLIVTKLRDAGYRPDQMLEILTIISGTCKHCWDEERGCQCWNDE